MATAMATDQPNLPGVFSEAGTAARFAGCWAERLKMPVAPVEALRLYRLAGLRPPPAAPGSLRTAGEADFDLIIEWLQGFRRDTGATVAPPETMRRRIQADRFFIRDFFVFLQDKSSLLDTFVPFLAIIRFIRIRSAIMNWPIGHV